MSVPEVAHSSSFNQRIMVIGPKDELKSGQNNIPWHNVVHIPLHSQTQPLQGPVGGTLKQGSNTYGKFVEVAPQSSAQLETLPTNMISISRMDHEESQQLKLIPKRALKPAMYGVPISKSMIIRSDVDNSSQRRFHCKSTTSFGVRSLPTLDHPPSGSFAPRKAFKRPSQRSNSVEPPNQVTIPSSLMEQRSLSVDADMMHSAQIVHEPIAFSSFKAKGRDDVNLPLDIDRYS